MKKITFSILALALVAFICAPAMADTTANVQVDLTITQFAAVNVNSPLVVTANQVTQDPNTSVITLSGDNTTHYVVNANTIVTLKALLDGGGMPGTWAINGANYNEVNGTAVTPVSIDVNAGAAMPAVGTVQGYIDVGVTGVPLTADPSATYNTGTLTVTVS